MSDPNNPKNIEISAKMWVLLIGMGFLSGMIIGQSIDNAYPMNDALHYHNPYFSIPSIGFELVWFIPLLYGTAGALIVGLITVLNKLLNKESESETVGKLPQIPRGGFNPSWGFTIASIIVFVLQWFLGCYLTHFVSNVWLFVILVVWGLIIWWIFDQTLVGLILCLFTACLGMTLEFMFVNIFDLYHYTNPDAFGLPIWIAGHYIGGTPANMNLGRKYLTYLQSREEV